MQTGVAPRVSLLLSRPLSVGITGGSTLRLRLSLSLSTYRLPKRTLRWTPLEHAHSHPLVSASFSSSETRTGFLTFAPSQRCFSQKGKCGLQVLGGRLACPELSTRRLDGTDVKTAAGRSGKARSRREDPCLTSFPAIPALV